MQRILVPLMIALAVLTGPALTLLNSGPASSGPVLVVAADPLAAIEHAGGTQVSPLRAPLGALADSPDPDFVERLREGGAWLVLDGRILAAICGVVT